jgi:hypothetical protein
MDGTRSLNAPPAGLGIPTISCRSTAIVILGLLTAAAAVITTRALAGALETPLEPAALLTAGAVVAIVAVIIRLAWLLPPGAIRITRLDLAVMVITSFAAVSLCAALCLPADTSPVAVWFFRVLVMAEECWGWLWFYRKWTRNGSSPTTNDLSSSPSRERTTSAPFSAAPTAEVVQQLTRSQAADGAEELSGWLRLPFAPGQRTGAIHVAFCPPLRVTPEVTVAQIDGPEVRIKTAQVLPYGARFDLKLAATAAEPTSILLQFSARAEDRRRQQDETPDSANG